MNLELNAEIVDVHSDVRMHSRSPFIKLLNRLDGKKVLVLSPIILQSINLVLSLQELQGQEVEKFYTFNDSLPKLPKGTKHLLYMIRSNTAAARWLKRHLKAHKWITRDALSQTRQGRIKNNLKQVQSKKAKKKHQTQKKKKKTEEEEEEEETEPRPKITVVFIPHITLDCEKELEAQGLLDEINVLPFPSFMYPIDKDLYSLGIDEEFKYWILEDITPITETIRSLIELQRVLGLIPNIVHVGASSYQVKKKICQLARQKEIMAIEDPGIDTLVLIDRSVDFITPLLTPLNYEGLIDEFYSISQSFVKIPSKILTPKNKKVIQPPNNNNSNNEQKQKKQQPKYSSVCLNSSDPVFQTIRDLNMQDVSTYLKQIISELSKGYEERHKADNIQKLKQFVKQLSVLQQNKQKISVHLSITEKIVQKTIKSPKFVEDMQAVFSLIADDVPLNDHLEIMISRENSIKPLLRFFCLQSLIGNGIKSKFYDAFREKLVRNFGYEHLFTLMNLERMGLLKKHSNKSKWPQLREKLRIFNENFSNSNDITQVFSGYAPLAIRIIQTIMSNAEDGVKEIQALSQHLGISKNEIGRDEQMEAVAKYKKKPKKPICMVFFIGGATYPEMSALRILGRMPNSKYSYIMGTTSMINAKKMMQYYQSWI
ncbi:vacuolar protein sorting-associated protein 33a [Anaeramoeba flamelloides]|uniref:Vacuolar protein sorting-associated protein 33a n=1 Tax=Anaeramoeba flamelloides TaxID=1746091 RepID=A0AAV7YEL1_9EUKA|nr:vacuolar protein sorting-associated protein 33a [Anaeramoeba flamelloides]